MTSAPNSDTASSKNIGCAVVTGAASGIGRAIVGALRDSGRSVIAIDINAESLESLKEEVAGSTKVFPLVADVTDKESISTGIASLLSQTGNPQVLVNAAGISTMRYFGEIDRNEWDRVLAVNTTGTFLVCQAVLPYLLEEKGCIINIASVAGRQGAELLAHYSASKFAVVGLTQSMAKELGPNGVRVNAVCPGLIRTAMQDREVVWEAQLTGSDPETIRSGYVRQTPLRRLGTPDDVARLVNFLASEDALFITGQSIHVDGGLLTY